MILEQQAPLAQLDRASGYGPEGRGFESLTACQKNPLLSEKTKEGFSVKSVLDGINPLAADEIIGMMKSDCVG